MAAKQWWNDQQKKGEQVRASLPQVDRKQSKAEIMKMSRPDLMNSVPMPAARTRVVAQWAKPEIQAGFNAFQAQIPKIKKLSEATKLKRLEQGRTAASDMVRRGNIARGELRNFVGTPEARFRELINKIQ